MLDSHNEILHSTKKEAGRSIYTDIEKCPRYKRKHQIVPWNTQYNSIYVQKATQICCKEYAKFNKNIRYLEMNVIGRGHLFFTLIPIVLIVVLYCLNFPWMNMNYLYFTNQNSMNMHGLCVFFSIFSVSIYIQTYTHVHDCMCMCVVCVCMIFPLCLKPMLCQWLMFGTCLHVKILCDNSAAPQSFFHHHNENQSYTDSKTFYLFFWQTNKPAGFQMLASCTIVYDQETLQESHY